MSAPGSWVCPWQSGRGGCVWSACGAGHHVSPCLRTCVREPLSEPEREGAEGIALSSQAQGRPRRGVAQRRGVCVRVPSCGARMAHSVRVFPVLWVFLFRVAVLRDPGK